MGLLVYKADETGHIKAGCSKRGVVPVALITFPFLTRIPVFIEQRQALHKDISQVMAISPGGTDAPLLPWLAPN